MTELGTPLKASFQHTNGITYLNQGAFGSAPSRVIAARKGRLWVRISIAVYNDHHDLETFCAAVEALKR